jgi:DNA polymerase-1
MTDARQLILVDGSSYLYRAYHALPPLTNADGEPTGAIYGVVNMIRRLLGDYDTDRVGVVFDAPGRTFRDDLFDQYKAHRPPMPDDLRAQREPLKRIIEAMGVPVIEVTGVEADDVIGTLAVRARDEGLSLVISTGDKDMAQLVNHDVMLLNTMAGTTLDVPGVEAKFGVPPERIADWLALVGDSSDNIPGVPRVGEKTAAKWLNQYGSLDAIMAEADAIGGKVGESLREHLDNLAMSRQLATIHRAVELPVEPGDIVRGDPAHDRLAELYRHYEFNNWLSEVMAESSGDAAASEPDADYECVLTRDRFNAWRQALEAAELVSLDLETDSLNYMDAAIVGICVAVDTHQAAYIPVAHSRDDAPAQLDRDWVLQQLHDLITSPECAKVGQNLKYDMSVLARYGIALRGVAYDTMLESYCLDATATRHDMDSLALKYLGKRPQKFEEVAGKGAKQVTFDRVPVDEATHYAAEDAAVALQLHEVLWPALSSLAGPAAVFRDIEMPLLPVLSRMERHGVLVDRAALDAQSRELAEKMATIETQAHEAAGKAFNLGSPKQIQEILFDELGLPVVSRTPKGQPSTAESVLEQLAEDYELPRLILDHRGLSKLKSTYTDKLPSLIHARTGRVHTSYHQAVAATGRLSSSEPNLQNIPVRTPEGRRIRHAFIAEPGYRLLAADYSQVELRIMAHLSGDEGLRRAFAEGEDIHTATAAEVFGVADGETVDGEQRRAAKAINFGLIYGMSAWGLARQLGIERNQAQTYVDRYFERYPGVAAYMEGIRHQAKEQGYVETVFGRRLYLPEITASNPQRRQYAERTAINAPMQGSAADLIKRAMIRVDDWLAQQDGVAMVMQVHDELILEVPDDRVDEVSATVTDYMASAANLDVPLEVEVGVGANWDDAH